MNDIKSTQVIIPAESLQASTLQCLIEEFVSREGTDYGEIVYSLEQKVAHVKKLLERGKVKIAFDAELETCTIIES